MNELNKTKRNRSIYYIIFILLICRWQSFMISINLREAIDVNDSNIYISILLSLIGSIIIFTPALILLKKYNYMNIIDISKKTFPKLGNIISIMFSIYFLLVAVAHVISTDLFMISYVYLDASTMLIVGIILVAIYAVHLGIETIFRFGTIVFILFLIMNLIIFLCLIPVYNIHYIGPVIFSDCSSIFNKSSLLVFNAEIVAMLYLAQFSKEKTFLTYTWFQIIICVMEVLLIFVVTISMGRYTNMNVYPLYTLTSMIEIPIMARIEAIYTVLDTTLSVIKTSVYFYLSFKSLGDIKNKKCCIGILMLYGIICLITSVKVIYEIPILKRLISFINSPAVVLLFVVVIPILILIGERIKSSYLRVRLKES